MTDDKKRRTGDYEVGRGKPPKQHQFKPGQSGNPSGGREEKRRKKEKLALEREREQQSMAQKVEGFFTGERQVRINGKTTELTRLEVLLHQLEKDALDGDPKARRLLFDIAQKNGWLKAPPPQLGGNGVLVVYPILSEAQWEEETEGELLPKDPLHGIPGTEGLIDNLLSNSGDRQPYADPDDDA